MIKSIVIDDDPNCIKLVQGFLKMYCPTLEVVATCNNLTQAVEEINKHQPNLLFLDIELNGELGFDLFKFFPHPNFQVIFTTSHQEYAIKAIKSSCLDFILKPIDPLELIEAVNKVNLKTNIVENVTVLKENLNNKGEKLSRIIISTTSDFVFIDLENIVCIEGEGKYTTFYKLDGEKIVSSENLGEYEKILDGDTFFRCHKSWIINLKFAKKFIKENKTVLMANGLEVLVSTRKKDDLFKLFSITK